MKSKILALSKSEDFRSLLKQKKNSNKYVTIFFGNLEKKNKKSVKHWNAVVEEIVKETRRI